MAIRINHEGVQCECDTAAEAAELLRLLAGQSGVRPARISRSRESARGDGASRGDGSTQGGDSAREKGVAFLGALNANGRKIIAALGHECPEALSTEAIAKAAGLEPAQVGPIMKHIYAVAERLGLTRSDVVEQVQVATDPPYKSRYRLREEILDALVYEADMKS